MRNIAVTILALVALAFGCYTGYNSQWCAEYHPEEKEWNIQEHMLYGGPQNELIKLFNNPCQGDHIGYIAKYLYYDGDLFEIGCMPETGSRWTIVITKHSYHRTDSIEIIKGRQAFDFMKKATDLIEAKSRKSISAWNP